MRASLLFACYAQGALLVSLARSAKLHDLRLTRFFRCAIASLWEGVSVRPSVNLVQKSTFCTIMVRSTFYPSLISSKMISWKFHACISMANHHKCPHNYTLPYRGSNFQSDFFAILIADSDSLQKTTWRKCLSFLQILLGTPSKLEKTVKNWTYPNLPTYFLVFGLFDQIPIRILKKER